jgi:hypothetical protein
VIPVRIQGQPDGRAGHAIDQYARRMLAVGKQRWVDDGQFEQWNLQATNDSLDRLGEVCRLENGFKDKRHGVEREGFGTAEWQIEVA